MIIKHIKNSLKFKIVNKINKIINFMIMVIMDWAIPISNKNKIMTYILKFLINFI